MLPKASVQKYLRPLFPVATAATPGGQIKDEIKCVLFDIYGTLFISGSGDIGVAKKQSHARRLESLLAKYGIAKTSQAVLAELYQHIEKEHARLRKKGVDFPEIKIDRIWQAILPIAPLGTIRQFAVEFELIVNPVYPMPHVKEMLSNCRNRGLEMGLISNAQFFTPYLFKWFLDADIEELGFTSDLVLLSYRLGRAKPSRVLFDRAAETLSTRGIDPSAALYLGNDMLNDIYPAKLAGFKTALFAGDARSLRLRKEDPRCRNLAAHVVITDLRQLSRHLNEDN